MKPLPAELMQRLNTLDVHLNDTGLLELALTHKSWAHERSKRSLQHNERLEFLGDAILELIISEHLYTHHPHAPEGDLARMRAAIVCETSLARAARRLGIGRALRLGVGEDRTGGRQRPSLLANAYEALVGAVYLGSGWDSAQRLVLHTLEPEIMRSARVQGPTDAKSTLQELVQKKGGQTPVYRLVDAKGPDHQKSFTSQVLINGDVFGEGKGTSKRASEQAAARQALRRLNA